MLMTAHSRNAIALVLAATTVAGCAHAGPGGYVPPEALDTPASNLSDALTTFATNTQTNTLAGYRRAAREDLIRADIRDFVRGDNWGPAHLNDSAASPATLLCKSRYGFLRIAVPLQNTSARAAAIKSVLQAPGSDVPTLLKALTKHYTIDPTLTNLEPSYDAWIRNADQGAPCATAVANADPFLTRGYIGNEIGVGAVLTAFSTIWGVVKPVVTGVLQNVDQERRNNEVKKYFADKTNVAALQADVEHTEAFLKNEFAYSQAKTAGTTVAAVRSLDNPNGAPWKAAFAIMNGPDCKTKFARLNTDKTDPDGVDCLNRVYAALQPSIKAALDAADAFDVSMDRQLPANPLSKQIDTVAAIARGEQPAEDKLSALWATLVRYATLYNTVKDADSDANRKKVDDAIDSIAKALK